MDNELAKGMQDLIETARNGFILLFIIAVLLIIVPSAREKLLDNVLKRGLKNNTRARIDDELANAEGWHLLPPAIYTWAAGASFLVMFLLFQAIRFISLLAYSTSPEAFGDASAVFFNLGSACFIAGMAMSHLVLYLSRGITKSATIKAIDYIYFGLVVVALCVNFSNMSETNDLLRRVLALDLAMTAVALRIAKTTAEILRWHR